MSTAPVFDPADTPAAPAPSLTRQQAAVLQLVAQGYEYKDIYPELFISYQTMRSHLRNALRALGAHNRPHAVALAAQAGLIDITPRRVRPSRPVLSSVSAVRAGRTSPLS